MWKRRGFLTAPFPFAKEDISSAGGQWTLERFDSCTELHLGERKCMLASLLLTDIAAIQKSGGPRLKCAVRISESRPGLIASKRRLANKVVHFQETQQRDGSSKCYE